VVCFLEVMSHSTFCAEPRRNVFRKVENGGRPPNGQIEKKRVEFRGVES
jgi:hypothetical protein